MKRIAFLFPGQGSPFYSDLGDFGRRMGVRNPYVVAAENVPMGKVADTSIAQPNIVAATIASAEALTALGVEARVGVGHSVGEIAALAWGDVLSSKDAVKLAEVRGRIMSELTEQLRPEHEGLSTNYQETGYLDTLRARVRLALRWRGEPPDFADVPRLRIRGAKHPLLLDLAAQRGFRPTCSFGCSKAQPA